MQLSPLQSRFAASIAASLILLVLYLFLLSPRVALAAEVPVASHSRPLYPPNKVLFQEVDNDDQDDGTLELDLANDVGLDPRLDPGLGLSLRPTQGASCPVLDHSHVRRESSVATPLQLNKPKALNLQSGTTACYKLEKSTVFGTTPEQVRRGDGDAAKAGGSLQHRDQQSKTVYISANTCLQPQLVMPDAEHRAPPQLMLLVSSSDDGECPETTKDVPDGQWKTFDQGAATYSMNATEDIYIGIIAPKISADYQGVYNFELAASADSYFHGVQNGSELLWMDSDSSAALLMTQDLTQDRSEIESILDGALPYELFVDNDDMPVVNGLRHSICGLEKNANISANRVGSDQLNNLVRTGMTTRGRDSFPKQQFYFEGLDANSSYSGILVKMGRDDVDDPRRQERAVTNGGVVFKATEFRTLPRTNCKVVTDLDFCDETQYAVPGNDKLNSTELAKVYDDYAKEMYSNFEKVMMQIPCEAPATSRYSLAKDCSDCKAAYKRWLCTVGIPRCEDFTSDNRFATIRNVGQPFPNGTMLPEELRLGLESQPSLNSSRNRFIDQEIGPGPYKEILPCEDICYEVVRSCPARMGLSCPRPRMSGFSGSYGRRDVDGSTVACNYPGEARTPVSGTTVVRADAFLVISMVLCALFALG